VWKKGMNRMFEHKVERGWEVVKEGVIMRAGA
jgi:hypothetical protein